MQWLSDIFLSHSAVQAVVVLSLLCACGLALGKLKVLGVSLGVAFVFFLGILAGHLGLSIDADMLHYAQNFGLVLFVYALGLQVGPGFFSSFHKSGLTLNLLAIAVVMVGTVLTLLLPLMGIDLSDAVGIMCGATTNTPALAAAQQTLSQLHRPESGAALGCAVTYPLGVVGVILAFALMRKVLVRPSDHLIDESEEEADHTFIATYQVRNEGVIGKTVGSLARISPRQFVISRLWRDGKVTIPEADTVLMRDDRLLVTMEDQDAAEAMEVLFGKQETTDWNTGEIDWNAIDSDLVSQAILVTKPEINGRKLGSLRLRKHYGVNISRVNRGGLQLLATPDLRLLLGDRIIVVGHREAIKNVEDEVGNAVKMLDEPNLITVFVGMTLGLILGSIPIVLPGISSPVKLGLAGGPIIVGILMGAFGPRIHVNAYTTTSANLMLRSIGLALYLACLGLASGPDFFATVVRPEGLLWVGTGFLLTVIPVLLVGGLALRCAHIDYAAVCGMLSGAMANPMAMNYANDTLDSDRPSVAYAAVYPLSMFLRVIVAQVILLLFL
ncbi:MAG: putative transporter [Muribaculaceae bacterium]|nr:putative transporter [Muribaculaceae bacterium]